jgi:hypothetical protein
MGDDPAEGGDDLRYRLKSGAKVDKRKHDAPQGRGSYDRRNRQFCLLRRAVEPPMQGHWSRYGGP